MYVSLVKKVTWDEFKSALAENGLLTEMVRVCAENFVYLVDVFGDGRPKSICLARDSCWTWLIDHANRSHSEVARMWGRDHTTILNAVKRHRLRLKAKACLAPGLD